jgi:hypothetical protein
VGLLAVIILCILNKDFSFFSSKKKVKASEEEDLSYIKKLEEYEI